VASSQLTDVYIVQLDAITGIDVYLEVSLEVRHWNNLETIWFSHSKTGHFRTGLRLLIPTSSSAFCVWVHSEDLSLHSCQSGMVQKCRTNFGKDHMPRKIYCTNPEGYNFSAKMWW